MTVTTTYDWFAGSSFIVNNGITAGDQDAPAIAPTIAGTRYLTAWTVGGVAPVDGRLFSLSNPTTATSVNDEFQIVPSASPFHAPLEKIAGLKDGSFVAVYIDPIVATQTNPLRLDSNIFAQFISASGSVTQSSLVLDTASGADTEPHVTGLADGGFAVMWMHRDDVSQVNEVIARAFDADGAPRGQFFHIVDTVSYGQELHGGIAALANGGFVAAYNTLTNDAVYFRRFDANGNYVDSIPAPIDGGSDIDVVGLRDGGFAVAYTVGGGTGFDIRFRVYNADGTERGTFVTANSLGRLAGDQTDPKITTLGNGMIVVTWNDDGIGGTLSAQVFDAAGNSIGVNHILVNSGLAFNAPQAIAGLSGASLATVWSSSASEGAATGTDTGSSIRSQVQEFFRIIQSDGSNDTLVGIDDGLREVLLGNGGDDTFIAGTGINDIRGGSGNDTVSYASATAGVTANLANSSPNTGVAANDTYQSIENLTGSGFNDTLIGSAVANVLKGGAGNDRLTGGGGDDFIDGGAGVDMAFFSGLRSAYTIKLMSDGVHVTGPDGADILVGVEFLIFDDAVVGAPQAQPLPTHWSSGVDLGSHPAGWNVVGTADFNADANADLLWYNPTTGGVDIWKLSDGGWSGSIDAGQHPLGWTPAGTGDFDGDGNVDLVWLNVATGNVDLWRLVNGHWTQSVDLGTHAAGSTIGATGDFDGDRTADILWHNASSGGVEIWKVSGGHVATTINLGTHATGSTPAGTGDFNGDGTSDIFWFNPSTGAADIWLMSGGSILATKDLGTHTSGWTPAGVGDFNNDGSADVLWFNAATGGTEIWKIVDGQWSGSIDLGKHPIGWTPVVGDFNHDGTADISWREIASGHIENWLLSNA